MLGTALRGSLVMGPRSMMLGSRRFLRSSVVASDRKVNDLFEPGIPAQKYYKARCDTCNTERCVCPCHSPEKDSANVKSILEDHSNEKDWSQHDLEDALEKHTLFTWGATDAMRQNAINIKRSEGIYFWDQNGKRYMDWNAMAMCVNLGHSPDQSIIDAVVEQMNTQTYSYPGAFYADIRPKLCKLLADICPGDINAFMFPSSGAEANEAAIRIARAKTGRHKIIARYRSYHGATLGSLTLTGDQRRWVAENGASGIYHVMDPYPYSFKWGETEEEICDRNLTYLNEVLEYEGPHNVAAIHMESITGTNGVMPPPKGYLRGVRDLCDKHGILLVFDEVMAGFGRTGKLFGFCHEPNVIPDIVTFAKGVNGAYVPLGGVGLRDHVADHIRKNPVGYGSTYNSHPVALASAYAALKVLLRDGIIQNAAKMEKPMQEGLQMLMDKHPSVKQARSIGLFACIDLAKNRNGDFAAKVTDPPTPALAKFRSALLDKGLFTMMRGHHTHCNPPLIINEEQIKDGISILDECLPIMDEAMED